jgi:hypothetical protein
VGNNDRWSPPFAVTFSSEPSAPCAEFLQERKEAGDNIVQRLAWLLLSDIPLDRLSRESAALCLISLAQPTQSRFKHVTNGLLAGIYTKRKRQLVGAGMDALAAEELIANEYGLTVEALRKRIQRAK